MKYYAFTLTDKQTGNIIGSGVSDAPITSEHISPPRGSKKGKYIRHEFEIEAEIMPRASVLRQNMRLDQSGNIETKPGVLPFSVTDRKIGVEPVK